MFKQLLSLVLLPFVLLIFITTTHASEIPEPLQEWKEWVLTDQEAQQNCPTLDNQVNGTRVCAWASNLNLRINDNGGQFSHLFRYNSEIYQRNLFYQNKSDEDWLLDRVISDNMVESSADLEDYTIDFQPTMEVKVAKTSLEYLTNQIVGTSKDNTEAKPEYVINQLVEMVKYAQSKGTDVELVINPYFPAFANKIVNIQDLKKAVEAKTGLPVNDYSLAIRETAGFGDYQHLNKTGARAFIDKMLADKVLK